MLSELISHRQSVVSVDPLTRSIVHSAWQSARIPFLIWLGVDRANAVGFAADLKPIRVDDSKAEHRFVPLRLASYGQSCVVSRFRTSDFCRARADGVVVFERDWPSPWSISHFTQIDIPRSCSQVLERLPALKLDVATGDLVRLSQAAPSPEVTTLTEAVLQFLAPGEVASVALELALGRGYPSMFEPLRAYFAPFVTHPRRFAPFVAWGGDPNCFSAGAHTYGDPRILPYPPAKVTIGRYCSIAEGVNIILGNHLFKGATTYPFKLEALSWPSQLSSDARDFTPGDITIGNDVWIGFDVTILAGAKIGDGAIIGAGSVVRGVVPPYTVFSGNPAKVVRERFPADIAARFEKLRWWDWPDWKVDRHSARMLNEDPAEFLKHAEADLS